MLDNLSRTDLVLNQALICLLRNAFRVNDFLEHVNHVIELTMYVTDDNDWFLDFKKVCFLFYAYQIWLRTVIKTKVFDVKSVQPSIKKFYEGYF